MTIHSNDIDDIAADVDDDGDDDDDDDASTVDDSTPRCGFIRLAFRSPKARKKKLSNAMCPYKNKTNYECYNNLTTHHLNETKVHHRHLVDSVDFATSVPVSRSIHNLSLNVYIYYNVADEDYVNNYLMPFLEQKCLTIIPETNYIKRPQAAKFVSLNPTEMYASRSMSRGAKHTQMILSTPTTSTEESATEKLINEKSSNGSSNYHKKSTASTTSTTTGSSSSSSSSSECHEESTSLTSS